MRDEGRPAREREESNRQKEENEGSLKRLPSGEETLRSVSSSPSLLSLKCLLSIHLTLLDCSIDWFVCLCQVVISLGVTRVPQRKEKVSSYTNSKTAEAVFFFFSCTSVFFVHSFVTYCLIFLSIICTFLLFLLQHNPGGLLCIHSCVSLSHPTSPVDRCK